MRVGENTGENTTMTIVDVSSFYIDLSVDELDIAQVKDGQVTQITLDALPDETISGRVTNVSPVATTSQQGTTSYKITVTLDPSDAPIRSGMSAAVQIVTSQKDDIILVPRRAVQAEGGTSYVLIPTQDEPTTPDQPASERRTVTIGLRNNESVEIVTGLKRGDKVLVQDVVSTLNPTS
jgi:HlyD family secretion protein